MKILIVGATGGIGSHLTQHLLDAGHEVRATSRRAPAASRSGLSFFAADLNDARSFAEPARGADSAFVYAHQNLAAVCEELRARGVRRITVLSTIDAANDSVAATYNRQRHLEAERAVESTGLPFTCLRPGAFVSNALRFFMPHVAHGDVVRLPFPDSEQAPIDSRDLAAVAALALTSDVLDGQRPVLTGPASLTQRTQVQTLGAILGRSLRVETIAVETARASMLERIPPVYVELLLGQWAEEVGVRAVVTGEVERLLGRPATAYAPALSWTVAHRER